MRKYGKPLKNCLDCRRLCFILNKKGDKTLYCKVFGDKFISKCERKVTKREHKQ